jgi:uncharacterized phage-associated protein
MQKAGDYEEIRTKYLPKRPADLFGLSKWGLKHIDDALDKYSDKSAKELPELSHKDIPWISAKAVEVIDYESGFYRTNATPVRKYEND